jgi:hypothetical protein
VLRERRTVASALATYFAWRGLSRNFFAIRRREKFSCAARCEPPS